MKQHIDRDGRGAPWITHYMSYRFAVMREVDKFCFEIQAWSNGIYYLIAEKTGFTTPQDADDAAKRAIIDLEKGTPSGIESQVCADIAERQRKGIAKYGQTVAQNPLELKAWLQHAYEEALDMAVYLKRVIEEMK